ncbi:hypothetical protein Fot_37546 [Forsythia ovata]|uniref:Uncharacterized protein n=1 Tax=Forsythia ovata TaxID=205694 RepID=A0ABD1RZA5_9LAMI
MGGIFSLVSCTAVPETKGENSSMFMLAKLGRRISLVFAKPELDELWFRNQIKGNILTCKGHPSALCGTACATIKANFHHALKRKKISQQSICPQERPETDYSEAYSKDAFLVAL